jgi:engulfment/cell motility protein 1
MSSHNIDDLTSSILDFQANIVRVTYRKKSTLVEPEVEPLHESALEYIWNCSKVQDGRDKDGEVLKWRKLGFSSENLVHEFQEVGELGLDCLVSTVIFAVWSLTRSCRSVILLRTTRICSQK